VLIPNGAYKGQKLTKLVRIKIAATMSKRYAKVPSTTSKKYKAMSIAARIKRIVRSELPIFFFISIGFILN
jgi:hypothetical protein